jgi:hypothetical protein
MEDFPHRELEAEFKKAERHIAQLKAELSFKKMQTAHLDNY